MANQTEQVRLRLNRAMLAQVDAQVDEMTGITRSDVIRRLLQFALVEKRKEVENPLNKL